MSALLRSSRALALAAFALFGGLILAHAQETPPAGAAQNQAIEQPASPAAAPVEAPDFAATLQREIQRLFAKCRGAIVRVEATDKHGRLSGTGFFVDPTGTLYTSYTVGGDSRDLVVIMDDLKYSARRLVADERSGIAILKVEAKTPFLPIGSSRGLAVASPVMTIGYPMDLPLTPSFGMVGGLDREYLGRYFATTHLRANLAVQRGQGGAPLLNMRGEAVGVLISSLDQGSASFVLPIEAAEKVRRDYVRFGELRPGWLGISVVTAPAARAGSTALIEDAFPNAPAEKAGIKNGDMLLAVGACQIHSPEDLVDACFFLGADEQVTLRVARGDEQLDFKVETTERPTRKVSPRALSLTTEVPEVPLKIGE